MKHNDAINSEGGKGRSFAASLFATRKSASIVDKKARSGYAPDDMAWIANNREPVRHRRQGRSNYEGVTAWLSPID